MDENYKKTSTFFVLDVTIIQRFKTFLVTLYKFGIKIYSSFLY